jgi:predicted HicB family RNase H-like nuclease
LFLMTSTARIEYSDEDGCFVGHISGIRDIVGFHGKSVTELSEAFVEAVDDYLETCERLGRTPQKPFHSSRAEERHSHEL